MNIVNFPELFGSKEEIIQFAEKVRAEHTLGLKSKVCPKRFRYVSREYSVSDYAEI
jgi:hypothetical protein